MAQGGYVNYLAGGGAPVTNAANNTAQFAMGIAQEAADPRSDPTNIIESFGHNVSAVGEAMSAYLPVIGGITKVTGGVIDAFSDLMRNIDATAERYGQYNAQISQAQGLAEVKRTTNDFRRAQDIGSDMAEYIMARSELEQKFEEKKLKFLMQILPAVTAVLEILEQVLPSGQGIEMAINSLLNPFSTIADAANQMVNIQQDKREVVEDPTTQILRSNQFREGGDWVPEE